MSSPRNKTLTNSRRINLSSKTKRVLRLSILVSMIRRILLPRNLNLKPETDRLKSNRNLIIWFTGVVVPMLRPLRDNPSVIRGLTSN